MSDGLEILVVVCMQLLPQRHTRGFVTELVFDDNGTTAQNLITPVVGMLFINRNIGIKIVDLAISRIVIGFCREFTEIVPDALIIGRKRKETDADVECCDVVLEHIVAQVVDLPQNGDLVGIAKGFEANFENVALFGVILSEFVNRLKDFGESCSRNIVTNELFEGCNCALVFRIIRKDCGIDVDGFVGMIQMRALDFCQIVHDIETAF